MLREYRTAHGRWTAPDPTGLGAVDPTNPQTWNRYAYVTNNPEAMVDLLGDDGCYMGSGLYGAVTNNVMCNAVGGQWVYNDDHPLCPDCLVTAISNGNSPQGNPSPDEEFTCTECGLSMPSTIDAPVIGVISGSGGGIFLVHGLPTTTVAAAQQSFNECFDDEMEAKIGSTAKGLGKIIGKGAWKRFKNSRSDGPEKQEAWEWPDPNAVADEGGKALSKCEGENPMSVLSPQHFSMGDIVNA